MSDLSVGQRLCHKGKGEHEMFASAVVWWKHERLIVAPSWEELCPFFKLKRKHVYRTISEMHPGGCRGGSGRALPRGRGPRHVCWALRSQDSEQGIGPALRNKV